MRYFLTFVLALTMSLFAADVKPFVFGGIASDSASQQNQFDYMLQYKLYGTEYIQMGRRVVIPDKSGWNGSDGYISSAEGISLGGPVLTDSTIQLGDGCQFTSGPIRAKSLSAGNDNNQSLFGGNICLVNQSVSSSVQAGINRAGGKLSCDNVPDAPVGLSMPVVDWNNIQPDTVYPDIEILDNYASATIDVPDGAGTYDILIDNIHLCKRDKFGGDSREGCTLNVRMQDGGRLTRIFVKDMAIGNHTTFNVIYRTDSTDHVLSQKEYRGNLMFYSNADFRFVNTDYSVIKGTFITTSQVYLKSNIDFAGQFLGNQLVLGDDFKGENFRFVPFDPDTLDIDPELNKDGGLRENDSTVIIPIKLSDTATVDVYFSYCFDLRDGVTVDDFNLVTDFPICGTATKTVVIPTGEKVPTEPIKVNVKKDTIVEPSDYLVLKISIESGAVLPNNKTDGELKIKIIDADHTLKVEFDTTAVYSEKENYTGVVDNIKIVNGSDSTRFILDSAYAGRYSLDSVTGVLTLLTPVDYETTPVDTIKVTLKDTAGYSVTGYIPVSVIDVNEAPEITTAEVVFSENLPVPAKIGTISWTDEDILAAFRNNAVEVLVPADGITVQADGSVYTTKVFDYETDPTEIELTVRVYDNGNPALADTATVKFVLSDIDESPSVRDTTFHVAENTTGPVGTLVAKDPEGKGLAYTIVGDTHGFTIDSTGKITNTVPFDYETEKTATITVKVSDGTKTSTATVKIVVDNVNEPVYATDTTFAVEEGKTGVIGKVTATDEDKTPVKYTVSDTSKYSIDSTGNLTLKTAYDYNDTKADTVDVIVTDGEFYDTAKVVVNVINRNEPPELQPNDSLTVPENCGNCIVGIITATDPDKDTLTFKVLEPGFTIDSAGVLKLTDPLDYEETPVVTVTVTVSDPAGASDTMTYTVKVSDINEPVHVKDTTCTVAENATGKTGCKVPAWDEDKTKPIYIITDTTRYSIDSTGEIAVKEPFDYEKTTGDTVQVIVTDGEFSDTATVVIKVLDVPEKTEITEVDGEPKRDTIRTNNPDHTIDYRICEATDCRFDTLGVTVRKDTTVKVCNEKKTSCDQVVFIFNDVPPVVILSNAKNTDAMIDYITIEEAADDGIYVNKKDNDLRVTVKDTVHKTEKSFDIGVKLDTVSVKSSSVKDYSYIIDESKAEVTPIGNGKAEVKEVVTVDGVKVTLTKIVDIKTMEPVDTLQTITYTVKAGGKDVTITYTTDNMTGERIGNYHVSYNVDSCTTVSYELNDNKKVVKNEEGNIGYVVRYDYVDDFGNRASAEVAIVFDNIPPKLEILDPIANAVYKTNAIPVKWTVNGEVQDTLTLQRLERGVNKVIRRYVDKAGNVAADTVLVIMKEAKDIDVSIIHPVTEVDKDKVDEFYGDGHKYDPKKPFTVQFTDPKDGKLPETIGVGFKIDIALPSVSATGGLATLDDIVKNGQIPVDDKGNIVGASTKGIPVDKYVSEHCTAEFQEDYAKNGLNITLYDVTYTMHLWVYTTQANYVNDFYVEYELNDQAKATDAGTVQMVVDWLADRDGNVKASNGHALGTSSYITKLYSKSIARHRCDYKEQVKGEKTVKKDDDMTIFGYKRPKAK